MLSAFNGVLSLTSPSIREYSATTETMHTGETVPEWLAGQQEHDPTVRTRRVCMHVLWDDEEDTDESLICRPGDVAEYTYSRCSLPLCTRSHFGTRGTVNYPAVKVRVWL